MKKILFTLIVLAMALALVTPVAAGGNGPGGTGGSGTGNGQQAPRGTFAMTGTITAIGPNTVTIQVYRGNNLVQPFIGTQVTITVTASTRYLYKVSTSANATPINFAALRVGNPVSANGTLANNVWTTIRITVGANLACLP